MATNEQLTGLRFEHEKRQRQVQTLRTKVAHLSRQVDQMYSDYERDRAANPALYREGGSYPGGLDSIPREIDRIEGEIGNLEAEMGQLERRMTSGS